MTLIVLAATMGNKYGGLKQLEGIGPNGETILDFSVFDAIRAGFCRIVFVISKHFEVEFKKLVSGKYEHLVDVQYVYQDIETLPMEKRNPKRTALYGSVRAVLMGKDWIDAPFGVINAVYGLAKNELKHRTVQLSFLMSFSSAILGAMFISASSYIFFVICALSFVMIAYSSIKLMKLEQ